MLIWCHEPYLQLLRGYDSNTLPHQLYRHSYFQSILSSSQNQEAHFRKLPTEKGQCENIYMSKFALTFLIPKESIFILYILWASQTLHTPLHQLIYTIQMLQTQTQQTFGLSKAFWKQTVCHLLLEQINCSRSQEKTGIIILIK